MNVAEHYGKYLPSAFRRSDLMHQLLFILGHLPPPPKLAPLRCSKLFLKFSFVVLFQPKTATFSSISHTRPDASVITKQPPRHTVICGRKSHLGIRKSLVLQATVVGARKNPCLGYSTGTPNMDKEELADPISSALHLRNQTLTQQC